MSSQEKRLLLYVWSGTCIGHTEDLKVLNSNYEKLTKDYHIVSVAIFMTPEGVKEFLQKVEINPKFPILADPKGNLTEIEKLIFLPATLIFDSEGKLLNNYPRFPLQRLMSFVKSDGFDF
ncbi:MAG TPA: redoxin domain-containing protein [Aquifex aeolicus]|nr:redoxin domain-containing protein [Aquifex aeolicus]